MSIPLDVQEFLLRYPELEDNPLSGAGAKKYTKNLQFYRNELRCQPDDLLIDELLEKWHDDFETLEYEHGFIQWLFPIREHGMNHASQPLQLHEIKAMRADEKVVNRLYHSYGLMLSFYGMILVDYRTGMLGRSEAYVARYRNLCRSPHNYLRITRILKCLSELGLEHLNAGFLLYILWEQSTNAQLNVGRLRSSMDRWWANCIRDEEERMLVAEWIERVRKGEVVFTWEMYEDVLEQRSRKRKERREKRKVRERERERQREQQQQQQNYEYEEQRPEYEEQRHQHHNGQQQFREHREQRQHHRHGHHGQQYQNHQEQYRRQDYDGQQQRHEYRMNHEQDEEYHGHGQQYDHDEQNQEHREQHQRYHGQQLYQDQHEQLNRDNDEQQPQQHHVIQEQPYQTHHQEEEQQYHGYDIEHQEEPQESLERSQAEHHERPVVGEHFGEQTVQQHTAQRLQRQQTPQAGATEEDENYVHIDEEMTVDVEAPEVRNPLEGNNVTPVPHHPPKDIEITSLIEGPSPSSLACQEKEVDQKTASAGQP